MTAFDLLDYRRRVAELYARARDTRQPDGERCRGFRDGKDDLFRHHPASPLSPDRRASFHGLSYAPHHPRWRVVARVEHDVAVESFELDLGEDGLVRMERVAYLDFELDGAARRLPAFWLTGYGGGLFVPFRDGTSGRTSYGGGRYLLDTIKHADLGSEAGGLVLDFNYAYAPSCAHDARWVCPLPMPESTLELDVAAGEMTHDD